jgi:hypothetical protein
LPGSCLSLRVPTRPEKGKTCMFKTPLLAAALLAAAFIAFQPATARAGADIEFYFGIDPFPNDFYDRRYYDDRVSCRQARRILRNHYGFHNIHTVDCKGDSFKFRASRHGRRYRVKLNAWTGRVTDVKRLH